MGTLSLKIKVLGHSRNNCLMISISSMFFLSILQSSIFFKYAGIYYHVNSFRRHYRPRLSVGTGAGFAIGLVTGFVTGLVTGFVRPGLVTGLVIGFGAGLVIHGRVTGLVTGLVIGFGAGLVMGRVTTGPVTGFG